MKEYYLDPESRESFRTIPKEAVRQYRLPEPSKHPACWDAVLDNDGDIIFSECSELTTGEITKLSKYDTKHSSYSVMFSLRDYVFPGERSIRDSKVHTSMSWMEDGRLVMLTHTTDKSPVHPAWLPASYYNHIWEGYSGSSLLIYDPERQTLENCGIPVPRETLYGGIYDPVGKMYYAIGFLRGHLYGIDLTNRHVRDFGQVTERASYRLVAGTDDNIYFSTRNGLLRRINVRKKEVEELHIQLPYLKEKGRSRPYISYAVNGPDGKLYIAGMHDDRLSRFDPKTGDFEVIGRYLAAGQFLKDMPHNAYIGSMGFDKEGVLYYAVCCLLREQHLEANIPAVLHRWDILGGGIPEALGILGTAGHATTTTCTMLMDTSRDVMYTIGSNHALNSPDILTIDMKVLRSCAGWSGDVVTDAYTVFGNTEHRTFAEMMQKHNAVANANTPRFVHGSMIPVRLWEYFDFSESLRSSVKSIEILGDRIRVLCGDKPYHEFLISLDGAVLEHKQWNGALPDRYTAAPDLGLLPSYPGRVYKAEADKTLRFLDGRHFCATRDGMLAVEKNGHWFSVGPAWMNGPVNDMDVTSDGTVYGVAGDREDIQIVFSYNDDLGLRYLGPVQGRSAEHGESKSARLDAIAVSGDASVIVIGAGGHMGTVYIYKK